MVGAKTDALESGLAKAERKIQGFAAKASKLLTSPFRAMQIPGAAISGFLRPIQSLLGSIPLVGGALGALAGGGGGFVSHIQEQMSAIVETYRWSQRLGVSTESLAGMQLLAGDASEAMARGLFHLGHEIGQAVLGSKEAEAKFAALGLESKTLADVPLDQAFGQIADKIKALPGGAMQAAMAFELFGKRGESLMPLLLKGSAGMADAAAKAKLLGLSFSQLDAQNVQRASIAMGSITRTVTGIFRQAAIGLAPYFEAVGSWLGGLIEKTGGVGPVVTKAFECIETGILTVIGVIGDASDALRNLLNAFKDLAGKSDNGKIGPSWLGFRGGWREGDKWSKLGDERDTPPISGTGDKWKKDAKDRLDALRKGVQVKPSEALGVDPLQLKLGADVGLLNEEIRREITTLGLGADAVKLYDLQQRGASEDLLKTTRGLIGQKDRLESLNKAFAEGHGILAGYREKLQEALSGENVDALIAKQDELKDKLYDENSAKLGGLTFRAGGAEALQKALAAFQELQAARDNLEKNPAEGGARERIDAAVKDFTAARDALKGKVEGWDISPAVREAQRKIDDLRFAPNTAENNEAMVKAQNELQKALEDARKSFPGFELFGDKELAKDLKNLDELGKKIAELQGKKAALDAARDKALFDRGADIAAKSRPGLDKFKEGFRDIIAASNKFEASRPGAAGRGEGFVDVNGPMGGGLLDFLNENASKYQVGGEVKMGSNAEAGSAEAQGIINKFGVQKNNDPVQKLQELIAVMKLQDANRAREAAELAKAVRDGKLDLKPAGGF